MIKVMLVDDEVYIRKILKKVIEQNDSFEVVAECDNMTDAIILYNQNLPDVIFMDIEINNSSGIDCAKVIMNINPSVKIIFATAHSEYMSNAFELYAFDYLVKPFDIARIENTLERISSVSGAIVTENSNHRLMVKGRENINFVDYEDLVMIERRDNSTQIYLRSGEVLTTSMSLSDVESKLNSKEFMRSHKSYLINLSYIKTIEPYGRWTYIVKFKNIKNDALLTKEKYEEIKKMYS